ncbi:hypothetical protein [Paenibacillus arenilitoris]|uniref:Uncharacterized protein n=1 Tax=Paenibacillus arenilitoris TaxID=2772299 RepID=A0A927H4Y9_9BACL|nr:hypothetical protein [Paenibacillus arenilitoris]MBD2868921.1 hypothetical protein [Paenibacillus arenilitoris]
MAERLTVLVVAFGGMLLYDGLKWRNRISKRDKLIYSVLLLVSLYMGADYALNKDWPDFHMAIDLVIGDLARAIEGYLNVKD